MDSKQTYARIYSYLRKQQSPSVRIEDLRQHGNIALAAAKSYMNKRYPHDRLDTFQAKFAARKNNLAIRQRNEEYFARYQKEA